MDYAIPGNDDAIRAVQLYARAAADAVLEGKAAAPAAASVREEDFSESGDKPARKAPAKKAAAKKAEAGAEPAEKAAAEEDGAEAAAEASDGDKAAAE